MKETTILFTPENVRKVLDGSKTQTRRVVKGKRWLKLIEAVLEANHGKWVFSTVEYDLTTPYGQPGDRLWVREPHYRWGRWMRNGKTNTGRTRWRLRVDEQAPIKFVLTTADKRKLIRKERGIWGWCKRSSRFMPKKAARLWLELTHVRVERLQDISRKDAIAEGMPTQSPITRFAELWESRSIHGPGSWEANPWVWVLEFRRVSP